MYSLLLCMASFGVAAEPTQYKAVLFLIIEGKDGTLSAEREITLPFVPTLPLEIDLHTVNKINYSTKRQAFILYCVIKDRFRDAKEILRIWSNGDDWKEILFLKHQEK